MAEKSSGRQRGGRSVEGAWAYIRERGSISGKRTAYVRQAHLVDVVTQPLANVVVNHVLHVARGGANGETTTRGGLLHLGGVAQEGVSVRMQPVA